MKKSHRHHELFKVVIPLLFLSALMPKSLLAQEQSLELPLNSGEQIILNCDRSIYGVDEQIVFSAIYRGPGVQEGVMWSRILYVELIHWDGSKQAISAVLINENGAMGEIRIPKNIPSGIYYLRAYTKWMRNYPPVTYAYLPLRILNPYSNELVTPPSAEDSLIEPLQHAGVTMIDETVFSGVKEQYESRELVEFEIQLPQNFLQGRYSLGISKTTGMSSAEYIFTGKNDAGKGSRKVEFLPETEGLSLSGKIIDSQSGAPVIDQKLQLSSYADPFFYGEVSSGRDGSFLFNLPHFTGKPEFQIAAATGSQPGLKILLESQFCNKPIHLPYEPLVIDSAEQSVVREILVNAQLRERFGGDVAPGNPGEGPNTAFYGSLISVTKVKDYIELTNLRECIYEILPQVSIRNGSNGEFLTIQGPACLDIYPPLVLMDNVPVPNDEELLDIPSSRIERIEVLNHAYMVGKFRYSGILSLFSNKKDMAGISQEGERYFFNLQLLDQILHKREYQDVSVDTEIPDIRNLLYWEPEIKFTEEGSFKVVFSTSDTSGQYFITLRGIDPGNSSLVFRKAFFTVK
jgi:hypothetical protein